MLSSSRSCAASMAARAATCAQARDSPATSWHGHSQSLPSWPGTRPPHGGAGSESTGPVRPSKSAERSIDADAVERVSKPEACPGRLAGARDSG
jgi:hypothetical protein